MSYVNESLLPGEKVAHRAIVHWVIFAPSLLSLSFCLFVSATGGGPLGLVGALICFAFFARACVAKFGTELAVTNKRVIAKFGFIQRHTIETRLEKIESIGINQGLLDRLFGIGTVIVHGTGGGDTPFPLIDEPMKFRMATMNAIEATQRSQDARTPSSQP